MNRFFDVHGLLDDSSNCSSWAHVKVRLVTRNSDILILCSIIFMFLGCGFQYKRITHHVPTLSFSIGQWERATLWRAIGAPCWLRRSSSWSGARSGKTRRREKSGQKSTMLRLASLPVSWVQRYFCATKYCSRDVYTYFGVIVKLLVQKKYCKNGNFQWWHIFSASQKWQFGSEKFSVHVLKEVLINFHTFYCNDHYAMPCNQTDTDYLLVQI